MRLARSSTVHAVGRLFPLNRTLNLAPIGVSISTDKRKTHALQRFKGKYVEGDAHRNQKFFTVY